MALGLAVLGRAAYGHEVKDLKYGAVLYEYYQQKYFETLVEYDYAAERGGIANHGDYPELLKGGVSLSYGLDQQAKDIFSRLIAENSAEEIQNRAWYYLAKMLYLRGDIEASAATLSNVNGAMPADIGEEYRYLAALVNIKLGYFDAAVAISSSFDKDSVYAPYLYFNLGVALGKEHEHTRAITSLKKSAAFAGSSSLLDRLGDRSHMAIAYLRAQDGDYSGAHEQIMQVSTSGVYSNRALLTAGWSSINGGAYDEALAPLSVLQQRSLAIPEAQEAILLVPHVYEKQGLIGRAAKGFIDAYDRYSDALEQLDRARKTLRNADVLELFVRNMDEMLGESDWFGTAPAVSLNSLSPFLLELMSDHSFQSVLKDLRDLYAIRNNLNGWKRKRDDFDVILASRALTPDVKAGNSNNETYAARQAKLQGNSELILQRVTSLNAEDKKRVQWMLNDLQFEIRTAEMMIKQLQDAPGVNMDSEGYARLVAHNMEILDGDLETTNGLIDKVEDVLLELINAELDVHEERLKYYRVQSHLAKARILDQSLIAMDEQDPAGQDEDQAGHEPAMTMVTPGVSGKATNVTP